MEISPEVYAQFCDLLDDDIKKSLTRADGHRFIRARKGDAPKAAAMARQWHAWREAPIIEAGCVTPNNILDNAADVNEDIYRRLMPHSNMCEDKCGRPIYYEQTGHISSRFSEVTAVLTVNELVIRHVRQQELMEKRLHFQSLKHGRPIEKQILVFNLENLSYAVDTNAMSTFRQTVSIDEAYYPERLQHFFMVNAPWFFTAIWALVKPWIDPVTADKIKILGSDFHAELREYIDDDQIPPELGGSCANFTWEAPYPAAYGGSLEQIQAKVDWGPSIFDDEKEQRVSNCGETSVVDQLAQGVGDNRTNQGDVGVDVSSL